MAEIETKQSTPPTPYAEAGVLLKSYRERHGKTVTNLADRLGALRESVYNWERGEVQFPLGKFNTMVEYLKLSKDEATGLMGLYYPELRGLDNDWLTTQPAEQQAGLYLAALRVRAGIPRGDFAKKIFVASNTLSYWESGKVPINLERVETIKTALNLPDEESEKIIALSLPFQKCRRGMKSVTSTQAGATIRTMYAPQELAPTGDRKGL